MKRKVRYAIAAIAGLSMLGAQAASTEPMRCSGEQKTCITNCKKSPNRAALPNCVTNCGTRGSNCMKTGCWDDGVNKYCGVLRK